MTTDARHILLALPVVTAAWIAMLAIVMRLSGAAPDALVLWPTQALMAHLPDGVSITSVGPHSVTLRGGPDLVASLYASGARLVLPAGLEGCLPQTAL
jgi:hypothetical protein